MNLQVLGGTKKQTKIVLDPRTKIILLITICFLVIGGQNSGLMLIIKPLLSLVPLLLLFTMGKNNKAIIFMFIYAISYIGENFLMSMTTGTWAFILLFVCGFISRMLPGILMGYYTLQTTTVSEFVASMERIHLSQKLIIPLSVMFRFFPTIIEEYRAIGDAMRMREIRIGGKKTMQMIEYRFIPMIISSVKIGEELSAAALTRGLGAPNGRTNICKIGFHPFDWFFILFCIILLLLNISRKFIVLDWGIS